MLTKISTSLNAAGDATARSAKQAKIKGEIMLLQQKITKLKHDFGPPMYDAMAVSINGPDVDRIFNETRQKIEALQAEVESKKAVFDSLNTPRAGAASLSSSSDASAGQPAPAPPPPGPPPAPPASDLPPGWKVTKTAEGKVPRAKEPFVAASTRVAPFACR